MHPIVKAAVAGAVLYGVALAMMSFSRPPGVTREAVTTETAAGRPCLGTLWHAAEAPKALLLMGHGVTSNQSVMATIAKAFAANGYAVVAFDFFGHGRSRERFHSNETGSQVAAWVAWAEQHHAELPVAYLGHSMGGVAGFSALSGMEREIPFVSLGMLPRGRDLPPGPVLLALGRFEQLFTPEQAHARAAQAPAGQVSVLVSPWSDHALETWDPVLIAGMVDWVDGALGLPQESVFPWWRWLLVVVSVPIGMAGILMLAAVATGRGKRLPRVQDAPASRRRWSINPYRLTARAVGIQGCIRPPMAGSLVQALPRAVGFALICVLLLSILLTNDLFVSRLDHPQRLIWWLLTTPLYFLVFWLDAAAIERIPYPSAARRFWVVALTRAVPITVVALAMQAPGLGLGFMGMMLGIFGFLGFMLALTHTLATWAANDYRAGAFASAMIFAWVINYWFPLSL